MAELPIVCPTHGRPGRIHAFDVLPDIPPCVARSRKTSNREAYPAAELIVHPSSVKAILAQAPVASERPRGHSGWGPADGA